jgi:hypothetical protein
MGRGEVSAIWHACCRIQARPVWLDQNIFFTRFTVSKPALVYSSLKMGRSRRNGNGFPALMSNILDKHTSDDTAIDEMQWIICWTDGWREEVETIQETYQKCAQTCPRWSSLSHLPSQLPRTAGRTQQNETNVTMEDSNDDLYPILQSASSVCCLSKRAARAGSRSSN